MARAAGLVVIAALIPLPVAASDTTTTSSPPTITASMKKIVVREVTAQPAHKDAARKDDRQGSSPGGSTGFFKSKPAMVALVVMAAGTGYALYSAQHDRIHSPGKQ